MRYKTNEIIKFNDYAELIIYSAKGKIKMKSKIDLEDVPYVEKYSWCERSKGYVGRVENGKTITLHRVLANAKKGECVDHINRDKTDNRKNNLRLCTQQKNLRNSSIKSNNSSGVTGVGFDKKYNFWRARICIGYKNIHLGYFDKKEDAIKARLRAEKKYYGEFAPQKKLFEKYNLV